jgi:hypothetical protein
VVLSTGLCKTGSRQSAKLSRLLLKGEVPREEPLPHGWERLDRGSPAMASRACRAGSKGERYGCQRPRAKGKMEQGGALLGARLGDFLGALAGSREEQDAGWRWWIGGRCWRRRVQGAWSCGWAPAMEEPLRTHRKTEGRRGTSWISSPWGRRAQGGGAAAHRRPEVEEGLAPMELRNREPWRERMQGRRVLSVPWPRARKSRGGWRYAGAMDAREELQRRGRRAPLLQGRRAPWEKELRAQMQP